MSLKSKAFYFIVFFFSLLFLGTSPSHAANYYVSTNPNPAPGTPWAGAWRELNQINWSIIQPGDTIYIDGGTSTMTYRTTMTIGTSGIAGNPIYIKKSMEPGHNGQVIIFGNRAYTSIFESCSFYGEPAANFSGSGILSYGIVIDEKEHIVIDGMEWRNTSTTKPTAGLVITRTGQAGILFKDRNRTTHKTQHVTVRNVEIYNQGNADQYNAAVELEGQHLTFENMIIYDNGEDAFHTNCAGAEYLTFNRIWSYSTFPRTDACRHADSIQIAHDYSNTTSCDPNNPGPTGDHVINGIRVTDSLFGPKMERAFLFGQATSTGVPHWGQAKGATVINSTIYNMAEQNYGQDYDAINGVINRDWVFDRTTSYFPSGSTGKEQWIWNTPSTYMVSNSIISGGTRSGTPQESNNCTNPTFANPTSDFSYDLSPINNTCSGRGSDIHTIADLTAKVVANNNQVVTTPTIGPSPTPTRTPTPTAAPPPGCFSSNTTNWVSSTFTTQTSTFTYQFDATPNGSGIDGVMGLSTIPVSTFSSLSAIVRFNTQGLIDAYHGSTTTPGYQAANSIPYSANQTYHFRFVVDIPNARYSAYVTPTGGSEQTIALNFGFRTPATNLGVFNTFNVSGSQLICNNTLGGAPGDFDQDNNVDFADFRLLLSNLYQQIASFNLVGSSNIDIFDFNHLVQQLF